MKVGRIGLNCFENAVAVAGGCRLVVAGMRLTWL